MNGRTPTQRPIQRLVCVDGHAFHTAFPASYTGEPCPTCGKPLRRAT